MYLVKRTCKEIPEAEPNDLISVSSLPLSAHDRLPAYVLLGDPGAGKTTVFEQEARRQDACYVTARDLITFEDLPEWHEKTLFIDGLDEIRAGARGAQTSFHAIRASLNKLGRPSFRLSCREADWFGASDREHLESVSPDGQVRVLHLDPLTEADILEIINHSSGVEDAEDFINQAKQRDLHDLLKNPQILGMLVKAIADGDWPNTRKQTFEMACESIVREHNREHIDATRAQPVDVNQQLDAAGILCAVQLIAGHAGYALSSDRANNEFPELNNPAFDDIGLLNQVARTKLFKAPVAGRILPIHRQVAEYLAARHLTERINHAGLPITRILALITGEDGVVVAELRGLSAWLAALCKSQRNAIIDRDPLGVVLYGDVKDFTRQDKRQVLGALQREAARYPWFRSSNWAASPFGALATEDMEAEFRGILTASDRVDTHQALVDCVLDAMTHGDRFPQLDNTLLDIVRDANWRPGIRRQALEIVQRYSENTPKSDGRLGKLLVEIRDGTVPDPDDSLIGHLLTELYPRQIPAEEVLNYLHAPKQRNFLGQYWNFWHKHLFNHSSDSDIRLLLDELVTRLDILQPILGDFYFRNLGSALLAKGLSLFGESIESIRLYEWLGVGLDRYYWHHGDGNEHNNRIRSWLETHPALQKVIIGIGLDLCSVKDRFGICMHKVRGRLYGAAPPADFGWWCLNQMQAAKNDDMARYLLREAVGALCYQRGDAGLSLDAIEKVVERESRQTAWLKDLLVCPIDPELQEHNRQHNLYQEEEHKKKKTWLRYVKSQETELREGRAYHSLLHDLATAYFGNFIDSEGDTPTERLRHYLGHDEDLVQAAFEGLRCSVERDDVPEVKDIIQLYTEDRTYYLRFPILAALDLLHRLSPDSVLELSDEKIRQALAFYLTDGMGDDPEWYQHLRIVRPDLVAEVMTTYVTAALRANKQHITGLYALAYGGCGTVARLASITLLEVFPVRSTNQQLNSLDELLIAALRYADRQALQKLFDEKLSRRSMNVAQRVRWLAAGLIIAPGKYLQSLKEFTQGKEQRVRNLAGFLAYRHDEWSPLDDLPVSALGLLVRLIGSFFAPYSLDGFRSVSPAMSAAEFVTRMINRLRSRSEKEATEMLNALLADPGLRGWQTELQRAQYEQRAARREAGFRHPDICRVSETLKNRSPANAGDLAALTTDILQELGNRIRNGNTDDYFQYWNEGPHRKADTPKHEDACRDALLSDLQQRFERFGIDAQPEGHYADDNRADIRVAFGGTAGFQVPVEIKKNSHPNLWRAMHQQLIAQYTRDPLADGFGIYLVFWFGSAKTQPPASGPLPRTADELEKRLRSTLSADEGRKISVCVIDVTKPA